MPYKNIYYKCIIKKVKERIVKLDFLAFQLNLINKHFLFFFLSSMTKSFHLSLLILPHKKEKISFKCMIAYVFT